MRNSALLGSLYSDEEADQGRPALILDYACCAPICPVPSTFPVTNRC
jgi:hypothetical protein